MLLAFAITEIVFGLLVALPLALYRIRVARWSKLSLDYPKNTHKTALMILVPIWNEELIIKKKLDDLIREYSFPTSLLVIDSASSDDSVEKVKQWLSKHEKSFSTTEMIEMPERLGKTAAVKLAIESLDNQQFKGLVLMTDADALIEQGTISRLHGWFADDTIGAVGSSANRETKLHGESTYRDLYETLREGESKIDSTPFLEGSCMMWRHGSFSSNHLNVASNADDSQITSLIRFGGLRSIIDLQAKFTDFAPSEIEGQRRQKIRRAQGLQTMLTKVPKTTKLSSKGRFSTIFRNQQYFHLTAPLIIFFSGITAILRWGYVGLSDIPTGYEALLHASLALIELTILTAWLTNRSGIRLPLVDSLGTILTGFEYLLISRFRILLGYPSNKWNQHSDTRLLMSKK